VPEYGNTHYLKHIFTHWNTKNFTLPTLRLHIKTKALMKAITVYSENESGGE